MQPPRSPLQNKPLPSSRPSPQPYQQPLGTGTSSRTGTPASLSSSTFMNGAMSRPMSRGGGEGSSRGGGERSRSRTRSNESLASAPREKLTRLIACDVILDNVVKRPEGGWRLPEDARRFVNGLGSPTAPLPWGHRPPKDPNKVPTPRKPAKVDHAIVRQNLLELCKTESSYRTKIQSVLNDFATPLRAFAQSEYTKVIGRYDARKLFINIEELVPISWNFEQDLIRLEMEMGKTKDGLPPHFGAVIYSHVRRMSPYKTWLQNFETSRRTRVALEEKNPGFTQFVHRTEQATKDSANTTGGLREHMAEPYQRISRYALMIGPMIQHLPPADENIKPLEDSMDLLNQLCSMEDDDQTQEAAVMWSLAQTIDHFPANLISAERYFIYSVDVEEIVDSSSTLRCTLFLFNDCILIAKRPNGRHRGRDLAGITNIPELMTLYSANGLAPVGGSPRKPKKKELGYRGHVDILECRPVDLGGNLFGLCMDNPPTGFSGERWNDRPIRRFQLASSLYPVDMLEAEKSVFLDRIMVAHAEWNRVADLGPALRSERFPNDEAEEGFKIYWQLRERKDYDCARPGLKNRIALQLGDTGRATDAEFDRQGKVLVIARLNLLPDGTANLSVRYRDHPGQSEVVGLDRIPAAIDAMATDRGLTDLPSSTARPSTPGGSGRGRPRPRSFMGVVNALGSGLKRTQSNASKASNATSTSFYSGGGTPNSESSRFDGSFSPAPGSLYGSVSGHDSSIKARVGGVSSPNWFGSQSRSKSTSNLDEMRMDESTSVETDGDDDDEAGNTTLEMEILRSGSKPLAADSPASLSVRLGGRSVLAGRRRSSSVPQVAPTHSMHLPSPEISAEFVDEAEHNATMSPAPLVIRRRPMGPREMNSRPSTPADVSPARPLTPLAPFEREVSPTPPPAVDRSSPPLPKRPLVEASPRASPAKKVASLYEDRLPRKPSPTETKPRVPSGSQRRVVSGGQKRVGRRIVSSTSTIRAPLSDIGSSRPADVFDADPESKALPPPPAEPDADMDGDNDEAMDDTAPLERLGARLQHFRRELSQVLANKENHRIIPTGLSRSPSTRNLKSIASELRGSLANPSTTDKSSSVAIDLPEVLRWFEELSDLVEQSQSVGSADSSPDSLPSTAEFETLTFERDMMQEDLKLLKEQSVAAHAESTRLAGELDSLTTHNQTLREMWRSLRSDLEALYNDFAGEIKAVEEIYQAQNGSARTRALEQGLAVAIAERSDAQSEVAQLRQELAMERAEKAKLEREYSMRTSSIVQ